MVVLRVTVGQKGTSLWLAILIDMLAITVI